MDCTVRNPAWSGRSVRVAVFVRWKLVETHDVLSDLSYKVSKGVEGAACEAERNIWMRLE